jgi:hypothetical protein
MPISPDLDTSGVRGFFLFDILSAGKAMVNSYVLGASTPDNVIEGLNMWIQTENIKTIISIETLPVRVDRRGYTIHGIRVWYQK